MEEESKSMEAGGRRRACFSFLAAGSFLGPAAAQREEEGRTRSAAEQEEGEVSFSAPVGLVIYREVPLPLLECWLVVDFGTRRGCFCMLLPSTSYASHFFF